MTIRGTIFHFRRASAVGTSLATGVARGNIGRLSIAPDQRVRTLVMSFSDPVYRRIDQFLVVRWAGHTQLVLDEEETRLLMELLLLAQAKAAPEPGAAARPERLAYGAGTTRTILQKGSVPDGALLFNGTPMPKHALDLVAGTGLAKEPVLAPAWAIDLGRLNPQQLARLRMIIHAACARRDHTHQPLGRDADNCVTTAIRAVAELQGVPYEPLKPEEGMLPIEVAPRLAAKLRQLDLPFVLWRNGKVVDRYGAIEHAVDLGDSMVSPDVPAASSQNGKPETSKPE